MAQSDGLAYVFAYPLPWSAGRAKGRAAYLRAMDVYHACWSDAEHDEAWTPQGRDLRTLIRDNRIKAAQVKDDALAGRIGLARCSTREELLHFVARYHGRASVAAATNSKFRIALIEQEFRDANADFAAGL